MKNPGKTNATIIVLLAGQFGVHKFLTGDIVMGIIYLCTLGLWGVGYFIDIIKVMKGTYVDKDGNPWGVDVNVEV